MTTSITAYEFIRDFLSARDVPPPAAERVASEAVRAIRVLPNWHTTRNALLEIHIWLFRALADGGHKVRGAELIAELLDALREQSSPTCLEQRLSAD